MYGARLRELREAKRLSQEAVAQASQMTRQNLAAIEKGATALSLDSFIRICKALGEKPGDMLDNSGGGSVPPRLRPIIERIGRVEPLRAETIIHVIAGILDVRDEALEDGRHEVRVAKETLTPIETYKENQSQMAVGNGAEIVPFVARTTLRPVDAPSPFEALNFAEVRSVDVRVWGEVAAGEPMEYETHDETVSLPEELAPKGNEKLLRVRGESMLEFDIYDGDFVIVEMRRGGVAATGEIVIGWFNEGITIKRWFNRKGRKILQAGNPEAKSYEIGPDDRFELVAIVRRRIRVQAMPKISG